MRIRILYTGGTIGMTETESGLAPGADLEGWLDQVILPALPGSVEVSYSVLPDLIDSSNATPESWQHIAKALTAARDDADAFVVLHGTDTMAYAAAALSYTQSGYDKLVVFTGSQLPFGAPSSDAAANVAGALHAASSGRPGARGVTLFFGQHLYRGNRATKVSSWGFEAYASPNVPALATAGAIWRWGNLPEDDAIPARGWGNPLPYTRHDIVVVDLVPGISATRIAKALEPTPEAVLLRAYGAGNAPSEDTALLDALAGAVAAGCPVIVCSQCPQATVDLGRYETGDALARIGGIGAGDMTFEAAYAKTAFLLSQGLSGEGFARWLPRSIAGEVTEPSPTRSARAPRDRDGGR